MAFAGPGLACATATGCTGWACPSPSPAGGPCAFSFSAIVLDVLARSANVVLDPKLQSDSELSVS